MSSPAGRPDPVPNTSNVARLPSARGCRTRRRYGSARAAGSPKTSPDFVKACGDKMPGPPWNTSSAQYGLAPSLVLFSRE